MNGFCNLVSLNEQTELFGIFPVFIWSWPKCFEWEKNLIKMQSVRSDLLFSLNIPFLFHCLSKFKFFLFSYESVYQGHEMVIRNLATEVGKGFYKCVCHSLQGWYRIVSKHLCVYLSMTIYLDNDLHRSLLLGINLCFQSEIHSTLCILCWRCT